jgi:hypothetical protein
MRPKLPEFKPEPFVTSVTSFPEERAFLVRAESNPARAGRNFFCFFHWGDRDTYARSVDNLSLRIHTGMRPNTTTVGLNHGRLAPMQHHAPDIASHFLASEPGA